MPPTQNSQLDSKIHTTTGTGGKIFNTKGTKIFHRGHKGRKLPILFYLFIFTISSMNLNGCLMLAGILILPTFFILHFFTKPFFYKENINSSWRNAFFFLSCSLVTRKDVCYLFRPCIRACVIRSNERIASVVDVLSAVCGVFSSQDAHRNTSSIFFSKLLVRLTRQSCKMVIWHRVLFHAPGCKCDSVPPPLGQSIREFFLFLGWIENPPLTTTLPPCLFNPSPLAS